MNTEGEMSEEELIEQAQQDDKAAMEALIRLHTPLIFALARRLCSRYVDMETLIQSGSIGLMRAVYHYQKEREVKLTTYAVSWILGEMKAAMRRENVNSAFCSLEGLEEAAYSRVRALYAEIKDDLNRIDLFWAIERLNKEEQHLIIQRFFRDKTQKEAAQLLQKSQAQISRIERHALDHLRFLLE